MEQKSFAPTAANYKALLDRTSAAMQSFAANDANGRDSAAAAGSRVVVRGLDHVDDA